MTGTQLSPGEEAAYQKWRSSLPKNLQFEGDYDLRGFYRKNPRFTVDDPSQHMTDEFKLPNHPTFSDESRYYNEQTKHLGGHWEGDVYIPNDTRYKQRVDESKGQSMTDDESQADAKKSQRLASIRQRLGAMIHDDPDGPDADRARGLLGRIVRADQGGASFGELPRQRGDIGLSSAGGVISQDIKPLPFYGARKVANQGDVANSREAEARDNPHDWMTESIYTGLPASGVGRALGAAGEAIAPNAGRATRFLGRAGRGAAEGGTATVLGGGDLKDIAIGGAMGGVLGGLSRPRIAQRAPRTQAEIDQAVIQEARQNPSPAAGMEGRHEPFRLAQEANAKLDRAAEARTALAKDKLNAADASFSAVDGEGAGTLPNTTGALQELQALRERTHGGQGPLYKTSDSALADLQHQLTMGEDAVPVLPRDRLRNVHVSANQKAEWEAKNGGGVPEGEVRAGAGVLSRLVRASDPRRGPIEPNIGHSLDEYAREMDDLANVEKLRGPASGRIQKLADVGAVNQESGHGARLAESEIRALETEEPAANPLIRAIRANNTLGRRGLQAPSPGYSPTMTLGRGLMNNASNLMFKLAPPRIDAQGMVAGQSGVANLAPLAARGGSVNPLVRAYLEAQQRDKELADKLRLGSSPF